MTRITDITKIRLHELATPEAVASASKVAFNDLEYAVLQKVSRPLPSANNTYDPLTIAPFLNSCRKLVEEELKRTSSGYSAFRWLWYLRRLPKFIFEGNLSTTYAYDACLAEVISGLNRVTSPASTFSEGSTSYVINYDLNDSVVRRVLKFCRGVRYLSQIHVLIRLAGKGAEFYFKSWALPLCRLDSEREEAIKLYDNRVAKGGRPLNRVGTVVASETINTDLSNLILIVHPLANPEWGPSVLGLQMGEHMNVEIYVSYLPQLLSLDELARFHSDLGLFGMQLWLPEVGVLLLLLGLAPSLLVNLRAAFITVPQYGYFVVDSEILKEIVNERIDEASSMVRSVIGNVDLPSNADDFLSVLEGTSGSAWPLIAGSSIRREGKILCIDLYTATIQLNDLLEFPRISGNPANVRADHFELTVQGVIDSSQWCPSNELRKLRGLKIRHGGRVITDLDAIGAHSDTLLIVSCKSLIYSAAYDIGDYAVVRNAATTIEKAVAHWSGIKKFLEANPKGDNYDFSGYRQLIAVVCTPDPVYLPLGPATQFVAPGLMAVSSLFELSNWLHGPKGELGDN